MRKSRKERRKRRTNQGAGVPRSEIPVEFKPRPLSAQPIAVVPVSQDATPVLLITSPSFRYSTFWLLLQSVWSSTTDTFLTVTGGKTRRSCSHQRDRQQRWRCEVGPPSPGNETCHQILMNTNSQTLYGTHSSTCKPISVYFHLTCKTSHSVSALT